MPQSELNACYSILASSKDLKKLTCYGDSLFSKDFCSKVNFKLRQFSIDEQGRDQQNHRNLNSFLWTQRNSLESVSIARCMNLEMLRTILSMWRLEKVSLIDMSNINRGECVAEFLAKNVSVASLHLPFAPGGFFIYELFFKAFPKIKSLSISGLQDQCADIISEYCKSLRNLSAVWFYAVNI